MSLFFAGPFLLIMLMFVPFLVDRVPMEGMPSASSWWITYAFWALGAH